MSSFRKHIPAANYTLHNKVQLIRGGKKYFDLLEEIINHAKNNYSFTGIYFQ